MKQRVIDDFSDASDWHPYPSGQATLRIKSERSGGQNALRLDFDFKGGGGFAVARRELRMHLPPAFMFHFRVRGYARPNKLEFKLADVSGRNVWRWQKESFEFTTAGTQLDLRGSEIAFAWGPAGGGQLRSLGAIEFVISAESGGRGTVWIEDFRFENRTVSRPPLITASSSARGTSPASLLDHRAASWRPAAADGKPVLHIDFHGPREFGGLIIEWASPAKARAFVVDASDDAKQWRTIHRGKHANAALSFVCLPREESRYLRITLRSRNAIRRIEVQPRSFSQSLDAFFHEIAARSPRGHFPRHLLREQSYWTCAGVPDGGTCALINEEGLVEPDKGTFTLEPFLFLGRKLVTWADARRSVHLTEHDLPLPLVEWSVPGVKLVTSASATGHDGNTLLLVRHQISNTSDRTLRAKLFVALRPHQVTPAWQAWNGLGGVSKIHDITWKHGAVWVNNAKPVIPLVKPDGFGAMCFEEGTVTGLLAQGKLPPQKSVHDSFGFATGAMRFDLAIKAGAHHDIFIAVPFGAERKPDAHRLEQIARLDGGALFQEALRNFSERLSHVVFDLPSGPAREGARSFRTAAGQILINRDGPALQPGPRRYTRSWIRDGAIMGAALQRMGDPMPLREFIEWYADFQREDGYVPCCVDHSGADPLVEHDSHGQFIFAVRKSFRADGDQRFLRSMWPRVRRAAEFIMRSRSGNHGGLLPESASHEGYLAHPVHPFWDDFWAWRGLRDAAAVARAVGDEKESRNLEAGVASLGESIAASLQRVISEHQLDFVPGSVEWADFDPTATASAVSLLHADVLIPQGPLQHMFGRYMADFRRKRSGELPWSNYSAYEIRIIGALVRLGKRADALELLEFFLKDRRPRHWNQWPEISWRDPRSPGHLGDVPHTWIGAEFMLAFASLFAYEREADDALVIGAGVDAKWISARDGASVRGLWTWHGTLDLQMKRRADGCITMTIGGSMNVPRGGFVLRPPCDAAIDAVTVNGRALSSFTADEVIVREFPADIIISFNRSR